MCFHSFWSQELHISGHMYELSGLAGTNEQSGRRLIQIHSWKNITSVMYKTLVLENETTFGVSGWSNGILIKIIVGKRGRWTIASNILRCTSLYGSFCFNAHFYPRFQTYLRPHLYSIWWPMTQKCEICLNFPFLMSFKNWNRG